MGKTLATFKGGIHPPYNKNYTDKLSIETLRPPREIVIPMSMHIGAPCTPVVEAGDEVKMGQLVGQAAGFVSANIHSSVSGKVTAVEKRLTGSGQKTLCVIVENDFKDTMADGIAPSDYLELTKEELLDKISAAGIVGLGGATFPARVKFTIADDIKIDYIILNGAECEPYLTCDHALMREYPEKVIGGLKIMMKILGLKEGHIGVEDNKPDAIEKLEAASDGSVIVHALETKYPQGGEKQLINAITGREVPSGKLPSAVGCVVANVATAAAVYDAVSAGTPVIERIVTVTGSGIRTPKVLSFRIGTLIHDMIESCDGLTEDAAKIILGGPMMGFAQYDTMIPSNKGTSGVLVLNAADAFAEEPSSCIRCAKCTQACPMHLMPLYISGFAEKNDAERCEEYNALDCIECGSCAFVCPARRPLVSTIRLAKRFVQDLRAEKAKAKEGEA